MDKLRNGCPDKPAGRWFSYVLFLSKWTDFRDVVHMMMDDTDRKQISTIQVHLEATLKRLKSNVVPL